MIKLSLLRMVASGAVVLLIFHGFSDTVYEEFIYVRPLVARKRSHKVSHLSILAPSRRSEEEVFS